MVGGTMGRTVRDRNGETFELRPTTAGGRRSRPSLRELVDRQVSADGVLDDRGNHDAFVEVLRELDPLHYVSIAEKGDGYDQVRDCPKRNCIVEALTSFAAILLIGLSSLAGHARLAEVDWKAGLLLGAGGVLGAQIGPRLLQDVPGSVFQKIFACVLLALAVWMFFKK